ncbi:MAG: hypothetical protein R2874_02550 [Desulfobacterales bacterium]
MNVLTDQPPEHGDHAAHGVVQQQLFWGNRLFPGKCQELPGEFCARTAARWISVMDEKKGMGRIGVIWFCHFFNGQIGLADDHPSMLLKSWATPRPAGRWIPFSGTGSEVLEAFLLLLFCVLLYRS